MLQFVCLVAFAATKRYTRHRKMLRMSKKTTALILGDLQNDFLDPEGAYGRAGATAPDIAALPERLAPLVRCAREHDILTVATLFTLVPGRSGEPMGAMRPKADA
jgi:nicotinamidase-related amidase